jgi:hypothetical protein
MRRSYKANSGRHGDDLSVRGTPRSLVHRQESRGVGPLDERTQSIEPVPRWSACVCQHMCYGIKELAI